MSTAVFFQLVKNNQIWWIFFTHHRCFFYKKKSWFFKMMFHLMVSADSIVGRSGCGNLSAAVGNAAKQRRPSQRGRGKTNSWQIPIRKGPNSVILLIESVLLRTTKRTWEINPMFGYVDMFGTDFGWHWISKWQPDLRRSYLESIWIPSFQVKVWMSFSTRLCICSFFTKFKKIKDTGGFSTLLFSNGDGIKVDQIIFLVAFKQPHGDPHLWRWGLGFLWSLPVAECLAQLFFRCRCVKSEQVTSQVQNENVWSWKKLKIETQLTGFIQMLRSSCCSVGCIQNSHLCQRAPHIWVLGYSAIGFLGSPQLTLWYQPFGCSDISRWVKRRFFPVWPVWWSAQASSLGFHRLWSILVVACLRTTRRTALESKQSRSKRTAWQWWKMKVCTEVSRKRWYQVCLRRDEYFENN